MKIKKKIARALACLMLLNTVSIYANPQKKLEADGIDPVVVDHKVVSEAIDADILPSAFVTFKKAPKNDSTVNPQVPFNDKENAEVYQIVLEDSLGNKVLGKQIESTNEDTYPVYVEDNLDDASKFENGRLYRLMVKPGHYHLDDEGYPTVLAPEASTGEHPTRYFITDFNTIAREADNTVEILWE